MDCKSSIAEVFLPVNSKITIHITALGRLLFKNTTISRRLKVRITDEFHHMP